MWAFAINAGERGELATAGDWSLVAAFGAGLAFSEATVCGVSVIFCAQRARGVFLFADSVMVSEGKTVFAVSCSRSSVEYRDTMSCGE